MQGANLNEDKFSIFFYKHCHFLKNINQWTIEVTEASPFSSVF